jgi:aminopeptidase
MSDTRLEKLAHVLTDYSLELQPGDVLLLNGSDITAPLLRAVYAHALRCGAHVESRIALEGMGEIFLKQASEEQLTYQSPIQKYTMETVTTYLTIFGSYNTRALSNMDPARQATAAKAQSFLRDILLKRMETDNFRWCGTQFPTHASAQDAGMSLSEYEAFVYGAGLLDQEDPVAAWKAFSAQQQRIADHLSACRTVRVVAEDTDLTVNVAGRQWINADGKKNFPDGEVFTGPIEDSTHGHIRFTFPAFYAGREVQGVRLWFERGQIVRWEAESGKDFLDQMLSLDAGARYLGEFAIGNNFGIQQFTRNTLFDEKIGGTVHIAPGASIPGTGGQNQSALHWDMVCDLRAGGEIFADGEIIQKSGVWTL